MWYTLLAVLMEEVLSQMKKCFVYLTAILMVLSVVPASFAEAPEDPNPVLITVNGNEITLSDFQDMAQELYSYGYSRSAQDYETASRYLISQYVYQYVFDKFGFGEYTDEENEAFRTEAETQWNEELDSYVAYYASEDDGEEELKALRRQGEQLLDSYGITLDTIFENIRTNASYDRLDDYILQNYDLYETDEKIEEYIRNKAEEQKELFESSILSYEYEALYGTLFYVPDGYRGIIQILVEVDDELLDTYLTLLASSEEEEGTVRKEEIEAAKNAILDSVREKTDDIYRRLENGERFEDLIQEYNADPGMTDEKTLSEGYMVRLDSKLWDEAFVTAAFDEKMQQVGDVSAPSIGKFGIYIAYYLRDIPAGIVALSEEEYEAVREEISYEKKSSVYNTLYEEWKGECDIDYDEEALLAYVSLSLQNGSLIHTEQTE